MSRDAEAMLAALPMAALRVRLRRAAVAAALDERPDEPRDPAAGHEAELAAMRQSFRAFLPHWRFINRETGAIQSFANLWAAQSEMVDVMAAHDWVFFLKAGKLGATELECAFDAWRAWAAQPNAHVGLFSMQSTSAKTLLGYVRFGLRNLPEWARLPIYDGPGGATTTSLILVAGPDDHRSIRSYATTSTVAIDDTLHHAHLDELSHLQDQRGLYDSVASVVAPDTGTLHVVTRGAGPDVYTAELWSSCSNNGGRSKLWGHFSPWTGRPRPAGWREEQTDSMTVTGALHFAPETSEDALAGDESAEYIPLSVWDANHWPEMPALLHGDPTPVVLALDAAVTSDAFAAVAVSRHPWHPADPAIRDVKVWNPHDFPSGRISFADVERWIRFYAAGGCANGHPRSMPDEACEPCSAKAWTVPRRNIVQITYDPYQLADMAERLMSDEGIWCDPFSQTSERLIADATLYQRAMRLSVAHNGDPVLREHVRNAKAKIAPGEDTRMRIVKRSAAAKIDAVVAASMGVRRILELIV